MQERARRTLRLCNHFSGIKLTGVHFSGRVHSTRFDLHDTVDKTACPHTELSYDMYVLLRLNNALDIFIFTKCDYATCKKTTLRAFVIIIFTTTIIGSAIASDVSGFSRVGKFWVIYHVPHALPVWICLLRRYCLLFLFL